MKTPLAWKFRWVYWALAGAQAFALVFAVLGQAWLVAFVAFCGLFLAATIPTLVHLSAKAAYDYGHATGYRLGHDIGAGTARIYNTPPELDP